MSLDDYQLDFQLKGTSRKALVNDFVKWEVANVASNCEHINVALKEKDGIAENAHKLFEALNNNQDVIKQEFRQAITEPIMNMILKLVNIFSDLFPINVLFP